MEMAEGKAGFLEGLPTHRTSLSMQGSPSCPLACPTPEELSQEAARGFCFQLRLLPSAPLEAFRSRFQGWVRPLLFHRGLWLSEEDFRGRTVPCTV